MQVINSLKFISKNNGVYKRNYSLRMNSTEEIFEIRSCTDIMANDIKIYTICQYIVLQLIKNYKLHRK